MDKTESKTRRKLNAEQLEVLELLYKFRFGSNDLIAQYFGKKNRSFVFKRLSILLEQELIGKRFNSSYRIKGKPAAYYLLPAGARKLQETRTAEDEAVNIKSIYKDRTVSETFIQHSLNIFTAYNQLKARYGDELAFFTKTNLTSYEHFPKPLPDAFVSLEIKNTTHYFFIEIVEDTQPFFTVVRSIKKYLDHKESGEWAITETDYPAVLFICESTSLQKRLQKQITKMLDTSWVDDLNFATTTKSELTSLVENDAIWQKVTEPDDKLPLQDT
ncbi:MAG TPA: replication-relaxation family protein [Candidatus Saccharimonadales bacterium]|nr:replication-relaxation family protein [Candidatus Saccharimonadales bacterium]